MLAIVCLIVVCAAVNSNCIQINDEIGGGVGDGGNNRRGNGGSSMNPFEIINEWKFLDFEYPTYQRRQQAIAKREFIPENNLPLGIDITNDRLFLTTPRWKDGVPASLSYIKLPIKELSPQLKPYPNWSEHGNPYEPNCNQLISVYRTQIDNCNRLWLIDSGIVNATVNLTQLCLPKIVVYDLTTNERIVHYELPSEQVKVDSLHSNIVVDVRDQQCNDAYAYVTDVWRYGIVVFSLMKMTSWRTTNHNYYPNPIASDFNIYNLNFQWYDGAFGMSLSPINQFNDRLLFFHPMASFKEFMIPTSILRNEQLWLRNGTGAAKSVIYVGNRGVNGQSTTSSIDNNLIMYYTLIHQDAIGCWDTKKPFNKFNIATIGGNNYVNQSGIVFPNDFKLDKEFDQGLWLISNKLPIFLYSKLNYDEINFRIIYINLNDAIKGTQCDPNVLAIDNNDSQYFNSEQCEI